MATTKEYRDFILDVLRDCEHIVCKPMMGEYLLYYNGLHFGGIYDNRLLVKITTTNGGFGMEKAFPYDGAKAAYLVEDLEDGARVKEIVLTTCAGLKTNRA